MKLSKKLVTGLLAATFVMGAGAITASAWDHSANAIYVELKSNMTSVLSEKRGSSKVTYYEGRNSSDKEQVWFEVQASNGNSWNRNARVLVSPATTLSKQTATYSDEEMFWRMELNPYGIVWGATGYGWIW